MIFNDGRVKILKDVLHNSNLARNLISISKMNDLGVHVTFEKSGCKLSKGKLILAKGNMCGTLFRLDASTFYNFVNVTDNFVSCKLWHHRMGHIGEKGSQNPNK